ncbi:plasma-membrane proton-e [Cantharellus anzutake]|uniref:plasma-membrane proton-e n=1 Tax=Cantharellus anzutake TaxID=1750568 RepID=UPI0019070C0E|nr:plasma-membrane proton-e [Cantharellus anzutake]KAF8330585.1 plasma-membrane proton-e [Cantharellus anzutake]
MSNILTHRKQAARPDIEEGSPTLELKRDQEVDKYANGEEYEILLRFVEDEAAKAKARRGDGDSGEEGRYKRLWYAPWKVVKLESTIEREAPPEWTETDITTGLPEAEVPSHREGFGYNELESAHENQILKFISYFRGPILYVMEIAVILSAGLRDWIDFGVIIGILFLNAVVGWYQEKQAGDIVEKLKAGIALKALVLRDGREQEVEARELVIGDIIILQEGHTIPADARILADYEHRDQYKAKSKTQSPRQVRLKESPSSASEGTEVGDDDYEEVDKGPSIISVDQSAITGESLAVDKYAGEIAYYTCGVKRGKAYAVVSASASQSFVGKTAALVMNANEKGHFQIVLGGIGTALLILVIFFIFAVWIGGFFRHLGIAQPKDNNLLVYALIFLIIGVPVGLPCVTTTTLAVGAAYLARKKCIVQRLTSIESLAGVDMLCTDKTGTLTANKLSLNEPYVADGIDRDWLMAVAVLASSHNVKTLDPIDKVTIQTLKDYPGAQEILRGGWITHKFNPFDPVSKRITAEVERDGRKFTAAKGAPNAILKLKKFDPQVEGGYRDKAQEFAKKGYRSLGVAIKEEGKDWELLGIMSMSDPPRGDTAKTIGEAMNLGIGIKMLTGDAVAIGKELARQLGLGTNIYDSERLIGGNMTGSDIRDFIEAADGFAEVYPEHKYQVVEFLQQRGHLVAMTGDGVNDAPSLKKADCGIAVEGASDAARSAAAVVFLDEGLSSIITSIKVARQIFHRMKAYIVYRIALCIHLEVYLMLAMIILNETIRVDLIVFLAIFADVATIAIAYDNAPFAKIPVEWQLPKVWIVSTIMGLLLAAGTWLARATTLLRRGGIIQNFGNMQEVLFLEVALTESWVIFITRLSQGGDAGFVWPSWQLVGAVLGVDILATVFAAFGWLAGAHPQRWVDVVTLVRVWLFSFGVIIVVAFAYILLNKISWLDRLGRKNRSKRNHKWENFLTEMQRLTLVHEVGSDGAGEYFRFASGAPSKPGEEESQKAK